MTTFIILPSQGLDITRPSLLSSVCEAQVVHAFEFFGSIEDVLFIAVGGGSAHKEPIIVNGGWVPWSKPMAQLLVDKGVPVERVIYVPGSWDTWGDAFFSMVPHLQFLSREGDSKIIVTPEYHVNRCDIIFETVCGRCAPPGMPLVSLSVCGSPLDSMAPEDAALRIELEQEKLPGLCDKASTLTSFRDLYKFLFVEHGMYAAGKTPIRLSAGEIGGAYG